MVFSSESVYCTCRAPQGAPRASGESTAPGRDTKKNENTRPDLPLATVYTTQRGARDHGPERPPPRAVCWDTGHTTPARTHRDTHEVHDEKRSPPTTARDGSWGKDAPRAPSPRPTQSTRGRFLIYRVCAANDRARDSTLPPRRWRPPSGRTRRRRSRSTRSSSPTFFVINATSDATASIAAIKPATASPADSPPRPIAADPLHLYGAMRAAARRTHAASSRRVAHRATQGPRSCRRPPGSQPVPPLRARPTSRCTPCTPGTRPSWR